MQSGKRWWDQTNLALKLDSFFSPVYVPYRPKGREVNAQTHNRGRDVETRLLVELFAILKAAMGVSGLPLFTF